MFPLELLLIKVEGGVEGKQQRGSLIVPQNSTSLQEPDRGLGGRGRGFGSPPPRCHGGKKSSGSKVFRAAEEQLTSLVSRCGGHDGFKLNVSGKSPGLKENRKPFRALCGRESQPAPGHADPVFFRGSLSDPECGRIRQRPLS